MGLRAKENAGHSHAFNTLSFELVVGHVSAVRTRLDTNEDETVAVLCCKESYSRLVYLVKVALRVKIPRITHSCMRCL